jgi:hypothetical protein
VFGNPGKPLLPTKIHKWSKSNFISDSPVLFYLFSARMHNSRVKIKRWCTKLIADYPLVDLHFMRITENLSDFLTREGLPHGDLEKHTGCSSV